MSQISWGVLTLVGQNWGFKVNNAYVGGLILTRSEFRIEQKKKHIFPGGITFGCWLLKRDVPQLVCKARKTIIQFSYTFVVDPCSGKQKKMGVFKKNVLE